MKTNIERKLKQILNEISGMLKSLGSVWRAKYETNFKTNMKTNIETKVKEINKTNIETKMKQLQKVKY